MMYKYLLWMALLVATITACKSSKPVTATTQAPTLARMKNMKLEAAILNRQALRQIPSASGMEYVQGNYYVLGDNSPFLYKLDKQYKLVQKYALFDTAKFVNGRIPKVEKPDLEGMTHFTYGRNEMLLLVGSGASQARNKGYLVSLLDKVKVQEVDLTWFYTFLKRILKIIEQEGELNIEGVAMDKAYAYLLQRPLGSNANVLFRFDADDFKDFLLRKGDLPAAAVYYFTLPSIGNGKAGFSGAYTLGNKLFVTASVEDTPNAIDDGQVLGSFVSVIDLMALPYASDATNPLEVPSVQLMNADGSLYKGKVESLIVTEAEKDKKYRLVVVTDDDQGNSELLEVELKVD